MYITGTACCGLYQLVMLASNSTKPQIQKVIEAFGRRHNRPSGGFRLQAVTTQKEVALGRKLKVMGFKPTPTWHNGNSGNTLTLWFKDIDQPAKPKK